MAQWEIVLIRKLLGGIKRGGDISWLPGKWPVVKLGGGRGDPNIYSSGVDGSMRTAPYTTPTLSFK